MVLHISTKSISLKYLSAEFYEKEAPLLKEILNKENRPYCVLLVEVKSLKFALPLRTNLPKGVGIVTVKNDNGGFKGIDFSKAILLKSDSWCKDDIVQLKRKEELLNIQGNDKKIAREFKKYVSGYITAKKNGAKLDSKYRYTTLINYHKELKITGVDVV